jgi:hypothetical protein
VYAGPAEGSERHNGRAEPEVHVGNDVWPPDARRRRDLERVPRRQEITDSLAGLIRPPRSIYGRNQRFA